VLKSIVPLADFQESLLSCSMRGSAASSGTATTTVSPVDPLSTPLQPKVSHSNIDRERIASITAVLASSHYALHWEAAALLLSGICQSPSAVLEHVVDYVSATAHKQLLLYDAAGAFGGEGTLSLQQALREKWGEATVEALRRRTDEVYYRYAASLSPPMFTLQQDNLQLFFIKSLPQESASKSRGGGWNRGLKNGDYSARFARQKSCGGSGSSVSLDALTEMLLARLKVDSMYANTPQHLVLVVRSPLDLLSCSGENTISPSVKVASQGTEEGKASDVHEAVDAVPQGKSTIPVGSATLREASRSSILRKSTDSGSGVPDDASKSIKLTGRHELLHGEYSSFSSKAVPGSSFLPEPTVAAEIRLWEDILREEHERAGPSRHLGGGSGSIEDNANNAGTTTLAADELKPASDEMLFSFLLVAMRWLRNGIVHTDGTSADDEGEVKYDLDWNVSTTAGNRNNRKITIVSTFWEGGENFEITQELTPGGFGFGFGFGGSSSNAGATSTLSIQCETLLPTKSQPAAAQTSLDILSLSLSQTSQLSRESSQVFPNKQASGRSTTVGTRSSSPLVPIVAAPPAAAAAAAALSSSARRGSNTSSSSNRIGSPSKGPKSSSSSKNGDKDENDSDAAVPLFESGSPPAPTEADKLLMRIGASLPKNAVLVLTDSSTLRSFHCHTSAAAAAAAVAASTSLTSAPLMQENADEFGENISFEGENLETNKSRSSWHGCSFHPVSLELPDVLVISQNDDDNSTIDPNMSFRGSDFQTSANTSFRGSPSMGMGMGFMERSALSSFRGISSPASGVGGATALAESNRSSPVMMLERLKARAPPSPSGRLTDGTGGGAGGGAVSFSALGSERATPRTATANNSVPSTAAGTAVTSATATTSYYALPGSKGGRAVAGCLQIVAGPHVVRCGSDDCLVSARACGTGRVTCTLYELPIHVQFKDVVGMIKTQEMREKLRMEASLSQYCVRERHVTFYFEKLTPFCCYCVVVDPPQHQDLEVDIPAVATFRTLGLPSSGYSSVLVCPVSAAEQATPTVRTEKLAHFAMLTRSPASSVYCLDYDAAVAFNPLGDAKLMKSELNYVSKITAAHVAYSELEEGPDCNFSKNRESAAPFLRTSAPLTGTQEESQEIAEVTVTTHGCFCHIYTRRESPRALRKVISAVRALRYNPDVKYVVLFVNQPLIRFLRLRNDGQFVCDGPFQHNQHLCCALLMCLLDWKGQNSTHDCKIVCTAPVSSPKCVLIRYAQHEGADYHDRFQRHDDLSLARHAHDSQAKTSYAEENSFMQEGGRFLEGEALSFADPAGGSNSMLESSAFASVLKSRKIAFNEASLDSKVDYVNLESAFDSMDDSSVPDLHIRQQLAAAFKPPPAEQQLQSNAAEEGNTLLGVEQDSQLKVQERERGMPQEKAEQGMEEEPPSHLEVSDSSLLLPSPEPAARSRHPSLSEASETAGGVASAAIAIGHGLKDPVSSSSAEPLPLPLPLFEGYDDSKGASQTRVQRGIPANLVQLGFVTIEHLLLPIDYHTLEGEELDDYLMLPEGKCLIEDILEYETFHEIEPQDTGVFKIAPRLDLYKESLGSYDHVLPVVYMLEFLVRPPASGGGGGGGGGGGLLAGVQQQQQQQFPMPASSAFPMPGNGFDSPAAQFPPFGAASAELGSSALFDSSLMDHSQISAMISANTIHRLTFRPLLSDFDLLELILGPVIGKVTETTVILLLEINMDIRLLNVVLQPLGAMDENEFLTKTLNEVKGNELIEVSFADLVPGTFYEVFLPDVCGATKRVGKFRTIQKFLSFTQIAVMGGNTLLHHPVVDVMIDQLTQQQSPNLMELKLINEMIEEDELTHAEAAKHSSALSTGSKSAGYENSWAKLGEHLSMPGVRTAAVFHLGGLAVLSQYWGVLTQALISQARRLEIPLVEASIVGQWYFKQIEQIVKDTFRLFWSTPVVLKVLSHTSNIPMFHSQYLLPMSVLEDQIEAQRIVDSDQDNMLLQLVRRVFEGHLQGYLCRLYEWDSAAGSHFGLWRSNSLVVVSIDIVSGRKKIKKKDGDEAGEGGDKEEATTAAAAGGGRLDMKDPYSPGFIDRAQWKNIRQLTTDRTTTHIVILTEKPILPLTHIKREFQGRLEVPKGEILDWSPTVQDLEVFLKFWFDWLALYQNGEVSSCRSVVFISTCKVPYSTLIQDLRTGLKIQQLCVGEYDNSPNDDHSSAADMERAFPFKPKGEFHS
jgi:hypothetical protein